MADRAQTDIVVVGAGVLGLSVACHLLDRNAGRVVVVDADTPAAGTSGAGAGFVGLWAAGYADFFTDGELTLEQYGIDYYRDLAEHGASIDHRVNGNLYAATTEDGWRRWVEPVVGHASAPPGTRGLSPRETAEATGGVLSAESVVGAALHPGGIQISAGRATRALADRLVAGGGVLRTHTRVTGLLTSDRAVTGVRTAAGDITAKSVVLACGAWTNALVPALGYRAPLMRVVATRVISPPSGVGADMPTVMVPDLYGLWLREHRGGLTYGNGDGYAPLFELDGALGEGGRPHAGQLVERLAELLSPRLRKLVPAHDTSVGWWLQGVPCMTPDRRFLAGPVPGVRGVHVVTGDNEAGVTHGPGLGRMMADLILDGGSTWIDPADYRLDRFAPGTFPTERSVLAAMPARR
ncbi:NAD(P)/FAD-dependent oxidoreductase [Embleya scabrispora]|uniref:NAD(P)/FAD-dependent oxidoreductase n=1 Tax=Embleya scabrispora TaxID=159449 RepID=UPI000380F4FA|nr:FAD-binding oxidoreductase [Embleya scabrispora]MYS86914.1 FAD-dependent oxidoreductase [Streptomyces sp. SID5474]